jgi:hypothetical protein
VDAEDRIRQKTGDSVSVATMGETTKQHRDDQGLGGDDVQT